MMQEVPLKQLAINPAFFHDIKDDREELLFIEGRIKYLLGNAQLFSENRKEFCELTELLCDQLALHFALEEAYGYFDEAVEVAPRLHHKALQLRSEHADLFQAAQQLCEIAYRVPAVDDETLSEQGRELIWSLDRHESSEMDLIQSAMNDDMGGGD
jgi:hypothetical protein